MGTARDGKFSARDEPSPACGATQAAAREPGHPTRSWTSRSRRRRVCVTQDCGVVRAWSGDRRQPFSDPHRSVGRLHEACGQVLSWPSLQQSPNHKLRPSYRQTGTQTPVRADDNPTPMGTPARLCSALRNSTGGTAPLNSSSARPLPLHDRPARPEHAPCDSRSGTACDVSRLRQAWRTCRHQRTDGVNSLSSHHRRPSKPACVGPRQWI